MSILVRNVSKRFGTFTALDDVSLEVEGGSLTALLGPERLGQVDAAPHHRRARGARRRRDPHLRRGRDGAQPAEAERRLRLPALRGVQAHDRPRQHRLRAQGAQAAEGGDPRPGRPAAEARPARGVRPPISGAALGWPAPAHGARAGRCAVEPRVLLLDEPFGALDARVRAELREWLRRLHDEVHVTTIFVTHDQAEAMDVASQIAVMNHARIEQVGLADGALRRARDRVRDELRGRGEPPRRELGATARARRSRTSPNGDAVEAMVERITLYGFDARIELTRGGRRGAHRAADARALRRARARARADRLGSRRARAPVRVGRGPARPRSRAVSPRRP